MTGDDLPKAIDKKFGHGSSLRFVHPMETYNRGRRRGFYVGFMMAILAGVGHEFVFHERQHSGWWLMSISAVALLIAAWDAYRWSPDKIIKSVLSSVDVYNDEKKK